MINQIFIPKLDANTEEVSIVEWYKQEKDKVTKGEKLLSIETEKAVIEVESENTGVLLTILAQKDERVRIPYVVGLIGESLEEINTSEFTQEIKKIAAINKQIPAETVSQRHQTSQKTESIIAATPAARHLAKEKGIDLVRVQGTGPNGEITARDIMAVIEAATPAQPAIVKAQQKSRVIVIGAGDGGKIVAELLGLDKERYELAGFLDDNRNLWDHEMEGSKVLGGTDQLQTLSEKGVFDSVIISITANMKIRRILFEKYRALGYKFINIIHPSVFVSPSARLGTGNLIYGMVYIGTQTVIGDNNLISAHSSIDHHNHVGSHNLFGPGVLTSGDVTIGDSCTFGAGVGFEPHLKIGNNIKIASGLAISSHVPDNTILKGHFSLGV